MAIIVGVDLAFFRNRFWERLLVNVGIVLVFAAFLLEILQAFMTATLTLCPMTLITGRMSCAFRSGF
jgi:hypothetical protein